MYKTTAKDTPRNYYMNSRPESEFTKVECLLAHGANKFIDRNKIALYAKYHDKRNQGAVILFLYKVAGASELFCRETFLTKDELEISSNLAFLNRTDWENAKTDTQKMGCIIEGLEMEDKYCDLAAAHRILTSLNGKNVLPLHSSAFQEAKMYWHTYPDQLVFLCYEYPIQPKALFWRNGARDIASKLVAPYCSFAIDSSLLNQKPNNSDCFVVTATFDDPDGVTIIDKYRNFRDVYLKKNFIGSILVYCYYIVGPHLASVIRSSQLLKSISKKVLTFIANFLPKQD